MCQKLTTSEYRRKLEHKIYLAQEHPARIYDLVDCNITQIPSGVFTFCKVLRKYSLNLSENNVTSLESGGNMDDLCLLGELVLTKNKIKNITPNFSKLSNLKKLIIDDNKLQKFPSAVIELKHLEILNLEGNFINTVPKEVRNFQSLKTLKISRNPIKVLYSEICEVETLQEFSIDINNIKNIPPDILLNGMEYIWKYFCKEKNKKIRKINFNSESFHGCYPTSDNDETQSFSYQSSVSSQRNKEIEKEVLEHERKLSILELENKQKNIDLIKREFAMEDEAIKAILTKKRQETDRLFDRIKYEELSSKELIDNIFEYNNKSKKREELEYKITSETYFDRQTKLSENEKVDVLDSMKEVLQRSAESHHVNIIPTDGLDQSSVCNIHSFEYIDQLQETEKQKLAFQQFQLEKDTTLKRLEESICVIELKLKQLSLEERNFSDSKSRSSLLSLLQSLEKERNQRKQALEEQIVTMENKRDKNANDFWIVQYQKLLDGKAKSDYEIEQLMKMANFEYWIPTFKFNHYSLEMILNISKDELVKMSLGNELERKRFLLFLNEWKFNPIKSSVKSEASAPPPEEEMFGQPEPSAPPMENLTSNQSGSIEDSSVVLARKEIECCICLNLEAMILLLNCGHVCCCRKCSLTVKECPLCRQKIVQRVNLDFRT